MSLTNHRSHRSTRIVAVLLLTLGACVDAPFARLNPADAEANIEMRIVGGLDTARTVGQAIAFQLVTVPAVTGHIVNWSSSNEDLLGIDGDGVFLVKRLPTGANVTVTIKAKFETREAVRTIVFKAP